MAITLLVQILAGLFWVVGASATTKSGLALHVDGYGSVLEMTVQVSVCDKLSSPERQKDRCHQAVTLAPASSRPRVQAQFEAPDLAELKDRLALQYVRKSLDVGVALRKGQISRRSTFWQIFAYSARIRR
ncbi:MAG: hypothetical protein ACR2PG_09195 [Hyphomicrobiaceae bacterium]